uniref:Rab-GAP TBC domain-containing protein n=1 Tax=Physcomitrium patens TaxID=3218 RepID=A0A7I4AKK1_PHYPA
MAAQLTQGEDPYALRPDCTDSAPPRFRIKPGKTLSSRAWYGAFNEQGQLNLDKVLKRIRRGGVDPAIRAEVWEFLLGCFGPSSTAPERDALRASRREQYAKLKAECQVMDNLVGSGQIATSPRINEDGSPVEEYNSGEISVADEISHHQIEDMNRGYQQTSKASSEKQDAKTIQWRLNLHQIGMSDFCSPLALMFQDEADAFWCFERIVSRVRDNFSCTDKEVGVQKQLGVLATLLKVLDPKLHEHIDSIGGGNYIFAFRMIMVLFRREFSFVDTLYLWEMMWALEYSPSSIQDVSVTRTWSLRRRYKGRGKYEAQNEKYGASRMPGGKAPLSLFCAIAIFEMQRNRLLNEAQGLDEVLKLLNDVTGKIDPKEACRLALDLHSKYLRTVRRQST